MAWGGGAGLSGGTGQHWEAGVPGAVTVERSLGAAWLLLCPLTRPFSPQQCGVISEHTKKMCTR